VKYALAVAAVLFAIPIAAAQDSPARPDHPSRSEHGSRRPPQPLPVVIPQQFAPPQEAYASQPESAATAAPATPSACQLRLAKMAVFEALPTLVGAGECGATDVVLMDTVMLPDKTKVAVLPPATMRCPMAEEVARWVREDIAPAVKDIGPPLRGLDNFASYDCRGRNNIRAAQLSEHGHADALDVRGFRLADGRTLGLTDVMVAKDWREAIKASVCARFSTVLGPGSDGYHEEHIHLDLAQRHNDYRVCEWDVREPRPVQAQAQDAARPAGESATAEDASAPSPPLDTVPLPRPRPVAQIDRAPSTR
jgi:hypothetical protein